MEPLNSIADEEAGILGDPSMIKSPDRVHTAIATPSDPTQWQSDKSFGNGIHVRNDVVVEVHQVDNPKYISSEQSSQHSTRY